MVSPRTSSSRRSSECRDLPWCSGLRGWWSPDSGCGCDHDRWWWKWWPLHMPRSDPPRGGSRLRAGPAAGAACRHGDQRSSPGDSGGHRQAHEEVRPEGTVRTPDQGCFEAGSMKFKVTTVEICGACMHDRHHQACLKKTCQCLYRPPEGGIVIPPVKYVLEPVEGS